MPGKVWILEPTEVLVDGEWLLVNQHQRLSDGFLRFDIGVTSVHVHESRTDRVRRVAAGQVRPMPDAPYKSVRAELLAAESPAATVCFARNAERLVTTPVPQDRPLFWLVRAAVEKVLEGRWPMSNALTACKGYRARFENGQEELGGQFRDYLPLDEKGG